jgi:hypothetical protein
MKMSPVRLMRRNERHRKEEVREQTRQEKALQKAVKLQARRADQLEQYQADIELARLEEETALHIKQLEARKVKVDAGGEDDTAEARAARERTNRQLDYEIEEARSAQKYQEGRIRARTLGDDDSQRASALEKIATMQANGILERARIERDKPIEAKEDDEGSANVSWALAKLMQGSDVISAMSGKQRKSYLDHLNEQLKEDAQRRAAGFKPGTLDNILEYSGNPLAALGGMADWATAGGAMFNPYAGAEDAGGTPFTRSIARVQNSLMIDSYGRAVLPDVGGFGTGFDNERTAAGHGPREHTVRAQTRQSRTVDGNALLKIIVPDVRIDDLMNQAAMAYGG